MIILFRCKRGFIPIFGPSKQSLRMVVENVLHMRYSVRVNFNNIVSDFDDVLLDKRNIRDGMFQSPTLSGVSGIVRNELKMKIIKILNACSLPWNQGTIRGYLAENGFDIFYAGLYLISNGSILLLFVSICSHHQAFYEMLRYSTLRLDNPGTNQTADERLNYLIRFQISVKE